MKIEGPVAKGKEQVAIELRRGARFVTFQYCISVLVITFRRSSSIVYIGPGESAQSKGLRFTIVSLLLGWWGIPWGPIWTVSTVVTNLRGGKDITGELTAAAGMEGIEIVAREKTSAR